MERLKIRYNILAQAVVTLAESIELLHEAPSLAWKRVARDSVIQRFEYCCEELWQLAKELLEERYALKVQGSRTIFRELYRLNIVSEDQLEQMLSMVYDRNETSHKYKEEIAKEIAERITHYEPLLKNLVELFKKEVRS